LAEEEKNSYRCDGTSEKAANPSILPENINRSGERLGKRVSITPKSIRRAIPLEWYAIERKKMERPCLQERRGEVNVKRHPGHPGQGSEEEEFN